MFRSFVCFVLAACAGASLVVPQKAMAVDVNADCAAMYAANPQMAWGQNNAVSGNPVRPIKGVIQREPDFGTCLVRATDHNLEPPTTYARNDYSRRQAFNADNSRFIVYASGGGWHLYDARTLGWIKQLTGPAGTAEPQWDATDPSSLYYVPSKGGMKLYKLNVATDVISVAADFTGKLPWSSTTKVWQHGEGSPSADGRYWCFAAETSATDILGVFTYDLATQTVLGSKSLSTRPDWVSMSPSGRYCVVSGTTAYTRDFSSSRQLISGSQHSDLAVGADGHDYYVFVNQAVDGYLTMMDMDTGMSTKLLPTWINGTTTSGHISGKAFSKPGWILYSSFNHKGEEQWISERVMAVEMKAGPRILNLAHHHTYYNSTTGDYWNQPHASVSHDFSRVVFNSNWGNTSNTDVDTYMVRLPDNAFGGSGASTDTSAPAVMASVDMAPGSITMNATATDNVGVSKVEFYIDGVLKGYDASAPYSLAWDTSSWWPESTHVLVAKAYDVSGNIGASSEITFTIPLLDRTLPTATASVAMVPGSITMNASASDNVGVSKVEFYIDGVLKGYDTSDPYSLSWDTSSWWPESTHVLMAKAYDAAGNVGASSEVSFTIPFLDRTAPVAFATVAIASGSITMGASASDNAGVSKVEFYIDGVLKGYDVGSPYSLWWDTSSWWPGSSHTLIAKAYDEAGNVGSSDPVNFTIPTSNGDTTKPTVSASVGIGTNSITMNANASDNVGVTKVEFFIDGVIKATDATAPYSVVWDTSSWWPGSTHTLVAKAYDEAGNFTTSSPVSFTISANDTVAPNASGAVSTNSKTTTLTGTAADNVEVSRIEIVVDGIIRGTGTTSPYSLTLDSGKLGAGSHTLVVKAYDAAGNAGSSSPVVFTISTKVMPNSLR